MKKILLFGMMALSMTAKAEILRGGISGGGGGTVIARPASPDTIKEILRDSRLALLMYFQVPSRATDFRYDKLYPKDQPSIIDVIQKNDIVAENQYCKDSEGRSVDGSVFGSKENSICISVKALSEKLSADQARPQTIALVAHEYSHLVGFNEEQAQAFQDEMVILFSELSLRRAREILEETYLEVGRAEVYLYQALYRLDDSDRSKLCENIHSASSAIDKAFLATKQEKIPFFSWDNDAALSMYESSLRTAFIDFAECAKNEVTPLYYIEQFAGASQVPLSRFFSMRYSSGIDPLLNYIRPEGGEETLEKELQRTANLLTFVTEKMSQTARWKHSIE